MEKTNLFLFFFVSLVFIFLVEFTSYLILVNQEVGTTPAKSESPLYHLESNEELGVVLPKNRSIKVLLRSKKNNIIYEALYVTDKLRRRLVEQTRNSKKNHLLLLGDSTVFGVGLNQDETIASYLQARIKASEIYNYGVYGYGSHQIYLQVKNQIKKNHVNIKNGIALYFLNPSYIPRALGHSSTSWNYNSQYFEFDDKNKLVTRGSFLEVRPLVFKFYKFLNKLNHNSNLFKLLKINFPIKYNNQDLVKLSELIYQTKLEYEKKFNGEMIVVIHPLYTKYSYDELKYVIQVLKNKKVKILTFDIADKDEYRFDGDPHPSAIFNKLFANKIADKLE